MTIQPTPLIITTLLLLAILAIMAGRYRGIESWRTGGLFLMLLALISPFLSEAVACGNCSAGFCCAAGWWVWRRHRPAWAFGSLICGLLAGTTLALGDVQAGRHPPSVAVWSAVLTFGLAHVLYLYLRTLQPLDADACLPRRLPGLRALLLVVLLFAVRGPGDVAVAGHTRPAPSNSPSMSANSAPMR
jgi:hypothetical protein